jgi:hypothetical protein
LKIRHPVPFSVIAGAAWVLCAVQAVTGAGGQLVICPFRLLTGHHCPGCGMGRAVVAAMRGDWLGSFHLHPLGIPVLAIWTAWLAAEAVRAARSGASARRVL